jgi:hypothetical protein
MAANGYNAPLYRLARGSRGRFFVSEGVNISNAVAETSAAGARFSQPLSVGSFSYAQHQ